MKKGVHIGYCRVSTDEQGETGHGLEVQEARIKSYANAMGLELEEIIFDNGYSGTSLNRPGLNKVLETVSSGQISGVIVAKIDRFSRSLRNLLNLYGDYFEAAGVGLVSVAEQFDTATSSGKMFFHMLGMFSEFEINSITERMTGGRKHKAKGGGYAGGGAAIGYQATRGGKVLELDQEKAATVRRVFELRQERPEWTLQQIADQLNTEGHSTAQGKRFKPVQVKRILDREGLYNGIYRYAGIEAEGLHKAII